MPNSFIPTLDEIAAAIDVLAWLRAVVDDPGWRDEISHVEHLLDLEAQP